MKAQHLNAMYARRRELEHRRIEKTEAVNRYYDHWGKVTSRYNNWTAPEYYKKADDKLQQIKNEKEKVKQLRERQKKLSDLLKSENVAYESEMKEKGRLKSHRLKELSLKTLESIDENIKRQDNIRRKLELESKLYGKWRHGVDDDKLLFQSKSDHEVMAKLNWLDKQVHKQMQREKDEAETVERNIRLQEELNKAEQLHKERQQIREQEIREIRTIQEKYMEQLQEKQNQSEALKQEEEKLRVNLEELNKEQELLNQCIFLAQNSMADFTEAYNLKKIKLLLRKRLDAYREQIHIHISMLERMRNYAIKKNCVDDLLTKYKDKYEKEAETASQIEAMYESEAKYNLVKYVENWLRQNTERNNEMNDLFQAEKKAFNNKLEDCLKRQEELLDVRSTCLTAIETASEKLKQLIKEEEESPRNRPTSELMNSINVSAPNDEKTGKSADVERKAPCLASPSSLPDVTKSFTNLNLDVWRDLPSSKRGIDHAISSAGSARSLQVVTPETAERPKYGRKRIAWT